MCDEDTAALVVDNGSGMCKVRNSKQKSKSKKLFVKKIGRFRNQDWLFTCDKPTN